MDIRQALAAASSALGLERLDAQLLLLHALGRRPDERAWLLAHDGDVLDDEREERFIALARRRAGGVPLAYLTGTREFHGLPLRVDARVLDPRPDTETLVEWALELLPAPHPNPLPRGEREPKAPAPGEGSMSLPPPPGEGRGGGTPLAVIDLGTGSGAIALALKHARPDARVSAVDASADALAVARANAQALKLDVQFLHGDWLAGIEDRFDLIAANPPYIAEADPHLEKLGHEPRLALVSGADGLDAIRAIVAQAPARLKPGGWLLLEHGWDQAGAVRALLTQAGFTAVQSRRDLAGIERCSGGRLPAA